MIRGFENLIYLLPPPFHFAICLAASYCLTLSANLSTIREFRHLFCIFIGNFDPIIPEDHTLKLAGRRKNHLIVYHPDAHFVPRGKVFQEAVLDFIKEWLRREVTGCPSVLPVASASYEVL